MNAALHGNEVHRHITSLRVHISRVARMMWSDSPSATIAAECGDDMKESGTS